MALHFRDHDFLLLSPLNIFSDVSFLLEFSSKGCSAGTTAKKMRDAKYFGSSRTNFVWRWKTYVFKEKIRTHLDLLSIPQSGGKKCQNV